MEAKDAGVLTPVAPLGDFDTRWHAGKKTLPADSAVHKNQAPGAAVVEQDEAGTRGPLAVKQPRIGGDVESPSEGLHRVG